MRPLLLALAAALLTPALAGCLTPGGTTAPSNASALLSPIQFPSIKKEQALVAMADGVKLDNWVYRPDAPGQFPVIIESRPYFGNLDPPAQEEGQKFSKWLIHEFVPRGYVVVLHSVRGTGDSGGCYGQGGITEQKDEAATVEAFAKMPYSDGKVGMIGKSYGGTTPWEAAVQAPPHLVTIVPVSGITEWYLYVASHGVWYDSGTQFNEEYPFTISFHADPTGADPNDPTSFLPPQSQLSHYPEKVCQDFAQDEAAGASGASTGDEDAFWQERDYQTDAQIAKIDKANVSVYVVHGLQDWNVKPDNVVDVYNKLAVPKHMQLGQWDHQYPLRNDWGTELLRWFDYWLKGVKNGIMDEPPVKLMDSAGVWHDEMDFPESRAVNLTLHPDDKGALAESAPKGSMTYVSSPATSANDAAPGQDKLVWAGAAEASTLRVSGAPWLAFNATITGPNAQFVATLYDINGSTWTAINWAHLDARHRDGADKPSTSPQMGAGSFRLRFYPMDAEIAPGHKLGLTLAGAGGFAAPGQGTTAQVEVETGTAALTLPTLPSIAPESPQPTMAKAADLGWTS